MIGIRIKVMQIFIQLRRFHYTINSTARTVKTYPLLCLDRDSNEKKMLKFLFFAVTLSGLKFCLGFNDLENPIVFYDLNTKEVLEPPITTVLANSENDSFNMSSVINIRLPFIGQPCKTGFSLNQIRLLRAEIYRWMRIT